MTARTLEKVTIVADAEGRGQRIVLSWTTGGNGREAEMLADAFPDRAAAEARALADYGIAADPPEPPVERQP